MPDQVFGQYCVDCKMVVTSDSYLQTYMGRLVAENGKIKLLREASDDTSCQKPVRNWHNS